ncbi:MAG: SDR family NAD(P)-dependent oxidoreductase [Sphingobacteriia bacterium]|nr:SDR family NAD(P)-dependent oxidoreductase [Sphingobacteriia bacterium]
MKVVITGGGTGIGKYLALKFASLGEKILILGRRKEKLEEVQSKYKDNIDYLSVDIGNEEDWKKVKEYFENNNTKIKYFINSAAVIEPINKFREINKDAFDKLMNINVSGPIFLIKELIPYFIKGSRVLNISSGAAHTPIISWLPYCISKAALWMVTQCLNTELKSYGIKCGSIMPGVVDTDMQATIRSKTENEFPNVENFRNMNLASSEEVAEKIYKFLTSYEDEEFVSKDWNVREVK